MNAADVFRAEFGREPEGTWSAPGRVNLIGEHTDYNGGYVLPFAIDMRTTVVGARRDDGIIRVRSLQRSGDAASAAIDELRPGDDHDWAAYPRSVAWVLREAGEKLGRQIPGADLVIDGRVPSGAGLSSSAAIECAVGLALLDLAGVEVALPELARLAQRAENVYVGVPCGLMDQMAVSVCRPDHALFFDVRDDVREDEPFAPHDHGLALLVIDTRAHHKHSGGEYADRRRSCEDAAARLGVTTLREIAAADLDAALDRLGDDVLRRRVRHVVTENARVLATVDLLRAGRLAEIGPLLIASHVSLRDDFEVSAPELDAAVDAAVGAGALGARMTGGGFGGSAIALVPDAAVERVTAAVHAAFADRDFGAPEIHTPTVSGGVRRDA
jgi:galactokinase